MFKYIKSSSEITRPSKPSDYKLTRDDINLLLTMFEPYESGRGLQIAKKLGKAYESGRTDVYLTFLEKDFAGYLLENPMIPDKNIIALEKIFKRPYKEMFDMYWDEKLSKSRR